MTDNIPNDENQTYDAQVADFAADMSDDDEMPDILQEIEQNEGYQSICRE
ncbi:hypothetical protein [Cohnella luojiensis]|nr:hypothetical protein [Cohnella luojiensis]